jgi:hypothetical protein
MPFFVYVPKKWGKKRGEQNWDNQISNQTFGQNFVGDIFEAKIV